MKPAAVFGIVLALMVFGQWTFFIATGSVPELRTAPVEIALHLAAEALFAVGLLVAGIGLLRARPWATTLFHVSAGMMLYSVVVSSGYFAQRGNWAIVGMFGVVFCAGAWAIVRLARSGSSRTPPA